MTIIDSGQGRASRPTGASVGWVEDWTELAKCRQVEPDALFVKGAAQQQAKLICRGCPVIAECLADALDHQTEFGVWGGMTERERRALLKRRPDVRSWRELFIAHRARQQAKSA